MSESPLARSIARAIDDRVTEHLASVSMKDVDEYLRALKPEAVFRLLRDATNAAVKTTEGFPRALGSAHESG
jgi:hypothetical protein